MTNSIYPLSAATIQEESEKLFSRIKKVIVPKSMLKEIDGETNSYLIRYRIVSEDKNRSSHWSPIFYLEYPPFSISRGKTEELGDVVALSWEDATNRPQYDIFVKYDFDTDYRFLTTTTNKNFNIFREANSVSLRAKVQVSATIKQIYNNLVIYESDEVFF
jgi:hypothetical protein